MNKLYKKDVLSIVRKKGVLLALVFLIGGCDFFKKEKIPLKGVRIPLSKVDLSQKTEPLVRSPHSVPFLRNLCWEQPGYNAAHEMKPFSLPKTLKKQWQLSCMTDSYRVPIDPVASAKAIFVLTPHGHVCAIDFRGKFLWKSENLLRNECLANLGGGLSLCGDRIYVTTSCGQLVALDASNGKIIWRKALASPARNAPLVYKNLVLVLTLKNQIEAVDATTGAYLWEHSGMAEDTHLLGGSMPAIAQDMIIGAYSSGEVVCLSLDGEQLWSQTISQGEGFSHIKALPVIHKAKIYTLSYNGQLSCFNLHSGQIIWSYPMAGVQTPIVIEKTLFCLSDDQVLKAFDACTGKLLWNHPMKGNWLGPIMAGGLLYLLSQMGDLIAIDPYQGGKIIMRYSLNQRCGTAPIVVNDQLIVLSQEGTLFLFSGAPHTVDKD